MNNVAVSKRELWYNAFRGFYRKELPIEQLDPISRWLYASRSIILVISAQAAIIAGLLAIRAGAFNPLYFVLLLVGLVVAHAISNLSNDYFGFHRGHDTPQSPRMRYTLHPLASNMMDVSSLKKGIWMLIAVGVLIAVYFTIVRGPGAAIFAALGLGILYWYDGAPRDLKSIGFGELATLIVWGPLMIGGGYFCLSGKLSTPAFLASIPYGLGVMSILVGKHIDQMEFDVTQKQRTLPIVLGEKRARLFNQASIFLMYLVVLVLVVVGYVTPFALIVFLNFPRGWKAMGVFSKPRPDNAPEGYIGWPLWYHRFSLVHNKKFGWLYILGLALGAAYALVF
ncbi:MAG: prenyltransferase [Bacteroidetes bacterium]|jgi:1,4-dihydroxy-2-naphthoate octaprenyltransferase|nr:prenyltransferase [Bacteroidota bacterium]